MFGCSVTTNVCGIPYLRTSGVTVGTETVDFTLGFRRIPAVGYITINVADALPSDATTTLPVRFTLNGFTRNLTTFSGKNATVADMNSTGIVTVFYDWYSGIFQAVSPLITT